MKIKKSELMRALDIVKPGLANKQAIEQSTSFAFIRGEVVTFNDEISIRHPVGGLNLTGAIEASAFYKVLSKLRKEDITIKIEGEQVIMIAGRTKAGFSLQEEIKLPLDQIEEIDKWKPLPETFSKHLRFAMRTCGRDMTKPLLTCVHVRKDGVIEGSDSYRLVQSTGKPMPVKNFLIPATSAAEVVKLNPINISTSDNWAHFQNADGTVISCRLFDDVYKDKSFVFDVKGKRLTFPSTISSMIDTAYQAVSSDSIIDENINVFIDKRRIKVRGESEIAWVEDKGGIQYKGEKIEFNISPQLFRDILKETFDCELCKSTIKFEGNDWRYIVQLRL